MIDFFRRLFNLDKIDKLNADNVGNIYGYRARQDGMAVQRQFNLQQSEHIDAYYGRAGYDN